MANRRSEMAGGQTPAQFIDALQDTFLGSLAMIQREDPAALNDPTTLFSYAFFLGLALIRYHPEYASALDQLCHEAFGHERYAAATFFAKKLPEFHPINLDWPLPVQRP